MTGASLDRDERFYLILIATVAAILIGQGVFAAYKLLTNPESYEYGWPPHLKRAARYRVWFAAVAGSALGFFLGIRVLVDLLDG